MYIDFWEPISKYWKTKFNIHPVLLYCGNDDCFLSEEYGTVHRILPIDGIPDYHSATWGRFWITKKYQDKICLVGDIDLIPLSHKFFVEGVEKFSDDTYVHLNAGWYYGNDTNAWKNGYNIVGAYGHLAKGSVFDAVYKFEEDFEQEIKKFEAVDYSQKDKGAAGCGYAPVRDLGQHLQHAGNERGGKWGQDEFYSTELLRTYFNRGGKVDTSLTMQRSQRIDRSNWQYYPQMVFEDSHYVDSHLLRPYSGEAKKHIDFLMHLVRSK